LKQTTIGSLRLLSNLQSP